MPVVAVIGAVAAVGSAIAGGVAQNKADNAKKDSLRQQAYQYHREAEQGKKIMGFELGQFDTKAGRYMGSGEAAISASGIDLSGSSYMAKKESITNLSADRENLWEDYDNKIKELKRKEALANKNVEVAGDIQGWNTTQSVFGTVATTASSTNKVYNAGSDANWW